MKILGSRTSIFPRQEMICQPVQCLRLAPERFERGMRFFSQILSDLPGTLQTNHRGIGRFLSGKVFSGAFAKFFSCLSNVEDVVNDLEREPEVVAELGDVAELAWRRVSAHRA